MKRVFCKIIAVVLMVAVISGSGFVSGYNVIAGASANASVTKVSTGVSVESAKEYLGFKVKVDSSKLPASMNAFKKIAVSMKSTPFESENCELLEIISGSAAIYTDNIYASIVPSAGIWYILVALCDEDKKILGYYETSVEITAMPAVFVPKVTTGVGVMALSQYNGFKAVVSNSRLPKSMKGFSKLAVAISDKPFGVEKNGLPHNITKSAKAYSNNTYTSAVKNAGKWYVLIVLCDKDNVALGYYEKVIDVFSVPEKQLQRITSGITVENATGYTGYEIKIIRGNLPAWAQKYSKIGCSVSRILPYNIEKNGLSFDLNALLKYTESIDGITKFGSRAEVGENYILIGLYDENNNPIGYLDTTVNVTDTNKTN